MLLVALTLFAVLLGWYVTVRERVRKQQDAIARLQAAGCIVHFEADLENSLTYRIFGRNSTVKVREVMDLEGNLKNESNISALTAFPDLREISLHDPYVQTIEQVAMNAPALEQLCIFERVTSDKLQGIHRLKNLRHLTLYDSAGLDDAGLNRIAALPRLKLLFMQNGSISADGFAAIAALSTLTHLAFEKTAFGDIPYRKIGGLGNLKDVGLSHSNFDDSRLAEFLAAYPNLESIVLSRTSITDAAIGSLIKLKKLQKVNLAFTDVTDKGAKELTQLRLLRELYVGPGISETAEQLLRREMKECTIHIMDER